MPGLRIRWLLLFMVLVMVVSSCTGGSSGGQAEGDGGTDEAAASQAAGEGEDEGDGQQPASGSADLSGKQIEVILIGNLSGEWASFTTPTIRGVQDAVEAFNEDGGINGGQISLETIDNGGLVEETVAAYKEVAGDASLVLVVDRQDAEALYELATSEKVPVLNLSGSVPLTGEAKGDYVFNLAVSFPNQFGYFLDFLAENWETIRPASAEKQDVKLAYISWADDFGQAALTGETRSRAKKLGIEIVYETTYSPSMTEDLVNPLLNALKAGANVIYTNTYLHGPAVLLNDLTMIGQADDYIVAGPTIAMDSITYGYLRQPESFNGFYAPFMMQWWSDEDSPGIQFARKNLEKHQRAVTEETQGYLLGQVGADVARYVLAQTIQQVGLEHLSGETVFVALSTLSDYQALDGLMTVDFSKGSRELSTMHIRQVEGFMDFVVRQGDETVK